MVANEGPCTQKVKRGKSIRDRSSTDKTTAGSRADSMYDSVRSPMSPKHPAAVTSSSSPVTQYRFSASDTSPSLSKSHTRFQSGSAACAAARAAVASSADAVATSSDAAMATSTARMRSSAAASSGLASASSSARRALRRSSSSTNATSSRPSSRAAITAAPSASRPEKTADSAYLSASARL